MYCLIITSRTDSRIFKDWVLETCNLYQKVMLMLCPLQNVYFFYFYKWLFWFVAFFLLFKVYSVCSNIFKNREKWKKRRAMWEKMCQDMFRFESEWCRCLEELGAVNMLMNLHAIMDDNFSLNWLTQWCSTLDWLRLALCIGHASCQAMHELSNYL